MTPWALRLAVWLAAASTVLGAEKGRRYAPSIYIGGVVNAASFTPAPDNFISPNAIISIFGNDLSLRTRAVSKFDLVGGRLPLTLGGVSVLIGGVLAPLYYVSPNQINAQAPSAISPGELPLRIIRESLRSEPEMVKISELSPGLFSWPPPLPDGRLQAVATHLDFSPIGRGRPEGATPTHPGKLVVLWATGLGQTAPFVFDGELPKFAAWIILPSRVWAGGRVVPDDRLLYVGPSSRIRGSLSDQCASARRHSAGRGGGDDRGRRGRKPTRPDDRRRSMKEKEQTSATRIPVMRLYRAEAEWP